MRTNSSHWADWWRRKWEWVWSTGRCNYLKTLCLLWTRWRCGRTQRARQAKSFHSSSLWRRKCAPNSFVLKSATCTCCRLPRGKLWPYQHPLLAAVGVEVLSEDSGCYSQIRLAWSVFEMWSSFLCLCWIQSLTLWYLDHSVLAWRQSLLSFARTHQRFVMGASFVQLSAMRSSHAPQT